MKLRTLLLVFACSIFALFSLSVVAAEGGPGDQDWAQVFKQVGVNLAGAEFGGGYSVLNKDYAYPGCDEIEAWTAKGIRLFRYPFRLERVFSHGGIFDESMNSLKATLDCAARNDASIILDAHNYARSGDFLGDEFFTAAEVGFGWLNIATMLVGTPGLAGYDLMNEPHDMPTPEYWPEMAQTAINSIRSVDTQTPILVAGDAWDSAGGWVVDGNAMLSEIRDTAHKIVFQAHQYYDAAGGSYECGSASECGITPQTVVDSLTPFLDWCAQGGYVCFLGETGVPYRDSSYKPILETALELIHSYGVGGTLWAAGAMWEKVGAANYELSLEAEGTEWVTEMIDAIFSDGSSSSFDFQSEDNLIENGDLSQMGPIEGLLNWNDYASSYVDISQPGVIYIVGGATNHDSLAYTMNCSPVEYGKVYKLSTSGQVEGSGTFTFGILLDEFQYKTVDGKTIPDWRATPDFVKFDGPTDFTGTYDYTPSRPDIDCVDVQFYMLRGADSSAKATINGVSLVPAA